MTEPRSRTAEEIADEAGTLLSAVRLFPSDCPEAGTVRKLVALVVDLAAVVADEHYEDWLEAGQPSVPMRLPIVASEPSLDLPAKFTCLVDPGRDTLRVSTGYGPGRIGFQTSRLAESAVTVVLDAPDARRLARAILAELGD